MAIGKRMKSVGYVAMTERRRRQGIGVLGVLVGILCLLLIVAGGWYWNQRREHRAELEAREQLKKLGAFPQFDGAQRHVESLIIRENLQEALPLVVRLRRLKHLDLATTKFGDDDVKHITGLPRLLSIDVTQTPLTDKGIAQLASLPIENLIITGTSITESALDAVGQMRTLITLDCSNTPVGGNLGALTQLPKLGWIKMEGVDLTKLDEETLSRILAMPKLEHLSLNGTGISAAMIERIKSARPTMLLDVDDASSGGAPAAPATQPEAAAAAVPGE